VLQLVRDSNNGDAKPLTPSAASEIRMRAASRKGELGEAAGHYGDRQTLIAEQVFAYD